MKPSWITVAVVCFAVVIVSPLAAQPGTTIITHGYQPDGSLPAWPEALAEAVVARAGGGTVLGYQPATGAWALLSGSADPAQEIALVFDWSEDSAWLPGIDNRAGTAIAAADACYAALRDPVLPGGLVGESLLEVAGLARPLHLIAHSRGASVNTELARRLVSDGLAVDHVTTLDPHAIDGPDPDLLDPTPVTYEGVVFADNYWRADGCDFDDGCVGFDFDGQPVPGAFDVDLGFLDDLEPFDNRLDSCTLEHTKVHTWYHGTVDLVAPSDGGCPIDRPAWYQNGGSDEGFFYALAGGGAGSRPCGPDGGCPDAGRTSADPVAVLLNGDFGFGAGQDAGWLWHGGGGAGVIVEESGDAFLELSATAPDRAHNRFVLADDVDELRLRVRVFVGDAAGDDVLEIGFEDVEGVATVVGSVDLSGPPGGWMTLTFPLPPGLGAGAAYTLAVEIVGGAAIGAVVGVDDVELLQGGSVTFRRGDCNADGSFNLSDPVSHLGILFAGAPAPPCDDACDSNDDGGWNLVDPIYALDALFTMGPLPPAPFPDCGADPSADPLDCGAFPPCP